MDALIFRQMHKLFVCVDFCRWTCAHAHLNRVDVLLCDRIRVEIKHIPLQVKEKRISITVTVLILTGKILFTLIQ